MNSLALSPDRIAYSEFDRIWNGTVAYTCVETNEQGYRFRRVDDPKMFECFSYVEMAQIERSRAYRYDRDWFNEGKVKSRQRSGVENFADLPKSEQPKIL